MASPKRLTDLTNFTGILPYASELFGIYQPLLGWKSKRIADRFGFGFTKDKLNLLERLKRHFAGQVNFQYDGEALGNVRIRPGVVDARAQKSVDSVLLAELGKQLPPDASTATDEVWGKVINSKNIRTLFEKSVGPSYVAYHRQNLRGDPLGRLQWVASQPDHSQVGQAQAKTAFEMQLRHESSLGGALLYLAQNKNYAALNQLFYSAKDNTLKAETVVNMLAATNPIDGYMDLDHLNPRDREELQRVAMSPISVVLSVVRDIETMSGAN